MPEPDGARLGAELRRLREASGLSGTSVAESLGWSQSKVSRMETGRFGASVGEVAALLDFYGVAQEVRAELLARVARTDGVAGAWMVRAGGPARRQTEVEATETRVKRMSQYAASAIPGLLQSPAYVKAVAVSGGFDDPAQLAAQRLARQAVLSRRPRLSYHVVLDEAALRRWPGGSDVVSEQLEHLSGAFEARQVDLRIRPLAGITKTFPMGPFIVYDFVTGPAVAMTEAQTTDLYLSAEPDIAAYRRLFRDLQREALDVGASRDLIEDLRGRLAP